MSDTMLEASELTKEFGAAHTRLVAVDGISLEVEKGEVVLIIGPSGSGKTTLLSMLGGLLTPTSGDIVFEGTHFSASSTEELAGMRRRRMGFVFQGFNLLKSLTARENVEVSLNLNHVQGAGARKKSTELLEYLGLGERLDYYPVDMSQGERQRVCVARALANDPALILADEPTGNLDSVAGHQVAGLLRDLSRERGSSVIMVTHDIRLEVVADRILRVEDGRIGDRVEGID